MSAAKKQYTAQERRQMAISAAEILLIEKGADGASMRSVAKQMGCAVSLLYKVFENQDALLLGVSERTISLLQDYLENAVAAQPEPGEKIRAAAQAYIVFALENPSRWRLLFGHRVGEGTPIPEANQQKAERLFRFIEMLLEADSNARTAADKRTNAAALWASIHGVAALAVEDKLSWSGREDPLQIVDAILDGRREAGGVLTG